MPCAMPASSVESLGLRRLAPGDRASLAAALARLPPITAEHALPSLYAWDFFTRLHLAEIEGALCLFSTYDGAPALWGPPLAADWRPALDAALALAARAGSADPRALYVPDAWAGSLPRDRYDLEPQGREYLYRSDALASMAGGRLKRRRMEARRFARERAWSVEPLGAASRAECERLVERWLAATAPREPEAARKQALEAEAARRMLALDEPSLRGLAVRVEGRLVAFSLTAPLGAGDEAAVLVEKTARDEDLPGLGAFVFQRTAAGLPREFRTINAGEDWDLPGLAAAKRAFAPESVRRTWIVRARS